MRAMVMRMSGRQGGNIMAYIDNLIDICSTQYQRFNNGAGKEYNNPYSDFVGEFWHSIGISYSGSTVVGGIRPAWSSAFVSFCVREAGGGNKFKYSEAHCHYVNAAMIASADGAAHLYKARRPEAYSPKVGDIICAGREYAKRYTYDIAQMQYIADSFYPSHGDIVVSVSGDSVSVVGGNVNDSVQRKIFRLKSDGTLENRVSGGISYPWIAVLEYAG
jgi:hypothetical protein